jgi:arylsulfatase A-like enzyme
MPTLLELMNVGVGAGIDGVSRARALQDPASWRDENVTCEWNHFDEHDEENSRALSGRSRITADGWKLNLYRDDAPELFDLNTDPGELRNLAGEGIHADRIRCLAEELRDWQIRTSDSLPLAV